MNLIVAVDKNWGIGYQNKLLNSIPEDMKYFRETTTGKVVVMGRKTLESFPNGLPLKNRTNIVITGDHTYKAKDAIIVHSIEEALEELKKYDSNDIYVDLVVDYDLRDWDKLKREFIKYMTGLYPDQKIELTIETDYV